MAHDPEDGGPDSSAAKRWPRGRGAASNPGGRYEPSCTVPTDDGWPGESCNGGPQRIATTLTAEASRSVVTHNDSPDVPFSRSVNPYRGCEHGCSYCFARPSHAYLGWSPGLDFESRLVYKPDAPRRLRETLARSDYRPETIALAANTDPYQPAERQLGLTRAVLEVLSEHRHPVCIITKSQLVLRDLDLLEPLAGYGAASVCISLTTLDHQLARRLEPRAPTPVRRLETISRLTQAGIPVCVLTSPVIPGLTDAELEGLLDAAYAAGARHASYALLRLPHELKQLFAEWLQTHAPLRKERVLNLLRQCRGGTLYRAEFSSRMRGEGAYAALIEQRFIKACERAGLARLTPRLEAGHFVRPAGNERQLRLF